MWDDLFYAPYGQTMAPADWTASLPEASPDIGGWFDKAASVAGKVASGYIGLQREMLNMDLQRGGIDVQRTMTQAQVDIAKAQSAAAIAVAQRQAGMAGAPGYQQYTGIDQTMANLNARIASMSGNDKLMLMIAAAGLVVAFLQLKGK